MSEEAYKAIIKHIHHHCIYFTTRHSYKIPPKDRKVVVFLNNTVTEKLHVCITRLFL